MSSAAPARSVPAQSQVSDAGLGVVDVRMRIRMHLIAAVAVVFLSIYGRLVCPFVNGIDVVRLVAGLCAVGLAQVALREFLYSAFPRPWGNASLARHGMYLAMASWFVAGLVAMALHMTLYPDFPLASHVKLVTGYWALGGGILSQLEFIMLERYLRRLPGGGSSAAQSVERITRRLMESYAVFTVVPALMLVLLMFRQVYEGYSGLAEAMEVTFVAVVFVITALVVAWRYGSALHEDCQAIRQVIVDVGAGQFEFDLDTTRPDELGLVARGINHMGRDLTVRESRERKLLEITSAFARELRLESLLAVITTGATEILRAERSSLYLYDESRDQLWTPVAEGLGEGAIYLDKSAGLAGATFVDQTVINLPDVSLDPRFSDAMDRKTGFVTRNMLCLPVNTREGRHLGVIQVLNRKDGPFDDRDEARLWAIASQAAAALENAQLFEDVLNLKNYDESILKSLSNGVISVDRDLNMSKVNAAAERVLGWGEAQLLDCAMDDVFGDEDAWLVEAARKVRDSGVAEHALDVALHAGGDGPVSVNVSVVPLNDISDQFIGLLILLEDLSAEKRVRTTMSRYLPKAVVDEVLASDGEVLEGRAQTMTLLFTDIRSFTTISEAIGPRATVTMLNEYFTDMVDIVDARGGILDKYIGDAIMALFGVPFAGEHDAANAVNAANEMMLALEQLNERRERAGQPSLMHGIGVNTGEAVAGNIGSPRRMDYTVIGDAVNLTARIESTTKFYGAPVLVSEMTLDAIDDRQHFREVDRIRVKGKTEPVTLYESYAWRALRLTDNERRAMDLQATALVSFRNQDWTAARRQFEQAASLNEADLVAGIYLERLTHYQTHAPGDDWDGVWTMRSK